MRFKEGAIEELMEIYKTTYPKEPPLTRAQAEEMGTRLVQLFRLFRRKPANMSEGEFKRLVESKGPRRPIGQASGAAGPSDPSESPAPLST